MINSSELRRSPQEFILWLLRKRRRFRVAGNSMLPLLQPGEEILIDLQAYRKNYPRAGDLVIALHPQKPDLKIVKRVAWITENGDCFLQGDNPRESTDSRIFGVVKRDYILGKVTSRFG
ncbi:MAG: nickel-type superoxide dismutase maturation protease [Cyanobacteria bacterium P01_E01_bin.42]